MSNGTVGLVVARRRLAVLWLSGAAVLVLFLLVQTINNVYGDNAHRAWAWLLPTILPTLSLIVGTIAYQASHPPPTMAIDKFAYRCAFLFSVFYLVLVCGTLLAQEAARTETRTYLQWLELSHLWLGPVQGVTAVGVAVFFQAKGTH